MVTSDFRSEMEIWPFRACAMKNTQITPNLWPKSPKFPRLSGNWGRGTPSGVRDINLPEAIQLCSQDALRMHYRQITYDYEVTVFHPTIIRTALSLWTWLWGSYHVPENVFLVYSYLQLARFSCRCRILLLAILRKH